MVSTRSFLLLLRNVSAGSITCLPKMTGHTDPQKPAELSLPASRPCRELLNLPEGTIYYERWVKKASSWLPDHYKKKNAERGHWQGVDRQDNTDLDYPGTRYNLHITWSHRTEGNHALRSGGSPTSEQVLTAELRLSLLHMLLMTFSLRR